MKEFTLICHAKTNSASNKCSLASNPVSLMDKLEKENGEMKQRISTLETALDCAVKNFEKNQSMIRKELFRMNKQKSHLIGNIHLMEDRLKEQNEFHKQLIHYLIVQEKEMCQPQQQEEEITCAKRTVQQETNGRRLNFNPIYD